MTKKLVKLERETNPYGGRRGLRQAWEEGYLAGQLDVQCPKGRPKNKGRHCEHWQEGDGSCCDCKAEVPEDLNP